MSVRLHTPITLTFRFRMLDVPSVLLPLTYSVLKFFSAFLCLNSFTANVTLRQMNDLLIHAKPKPQFN